MYNQREQNFALNAGCLGYKCSVYDAVFNRQKCFWTPYDVEINEHQTRYVIFAATDEGCLHQARGELDDALSAQLVGVISQDVQTSQRGNK